MLNEETVEGPFVDLRGYLAKHKSGSRVQGRDWEPDKDNIDDLKNVYFDYIRAGYRTAHQIREIGNPSKGQGFFNHKKIWDAFIKRYDDEISPINEKEKSLETWRQERPEELLINIIKARDSDWKDKVGTPKKKGSLLTENIQKTSRDLSDQNEGDQAMVLLQRAFNSLSAINKDSDSIEGEEVKNISHDIRKLVEGFIKTVERKAKNK